MDTDFKNKVAYVVFGLMTSGACIYCMVEPLVRQSNTMMRQQLEDSTPGPFDEAFARTLGKAEYETYKNRNEKILDLSPFIGDADKQSWTPESLGLEFDLSDWDRD